MASAELPLTLPFQPVRMSVERYHALTRAGAFTEHDQVELLDGVVTEKVSKNPPHRLVTRRCDLLLSQMVPEAWHVQNQEPITLQNSEPEPDVAVIRGCLEDYPDRHPGLGEVELVAEVADTTLVTDRFKAKIYAFACIPTYWLVDLAENQIEVMSEPRLSGQTASYERTEFFRIGDSLQVVLDGQLAGEIAVTELLG